MILIKNIGIIRSMAGSRKDSDIAGGYILIDGKKIAGIGRGESPVGDLPSGDLPTGNSATGDLPFDIQIIDAKGGQVMPGLIDAHCHIGMFEDAVRWEGDDGNETTDPITPHLRAIDAIYHADKAFSEAVNSGVTTVVTGPGSANVLGGQFVAMKTVGRRIDEMIIREPIAVKAAFGENPKHVYGESNKAPGTRMATAALFRETMFKALEYMNKIDKHENDPAENDKPDYDMKLETIIRILKGELPIKAHAHRADDIMTAIRLAKEFNLKLTIDHCTEGYLIKDILLEEGFPVITGPLLTDRSKIELRNQTLRNPGILAKAGVKVAISTDAPCVPIQYLILSAAMAAREGMDEYEAMKAITINAATITGISDRVGSIEVGKDADLAIFSGHPFDINSKVTMTIINGKVAYESSKVADERSKA